MVLYWEPWMSLSFYRMSRFFSPLSPAPPLSLARTAPRPPPNPLDQLTEPTLQRRCRKKKRGVVGKFLLVFMMEQKRRSQSEYIPFFIKRIERRNTYQSPKKRMANPERAMAAPARAWLKRSRMCRLIKRIP